MNMLQQPYDYTCLDIYDYTYLDIMEDYITLYYQQFVTLGDLRDCLNALATTIHKLPLNWKGKLTCESNRLEVTYAVMLDANRRTLSSYEHQVAEEHIAKIITLIAECKTSITSGSTTEKKSFDPEIFDNSCYLLMMEDYINIYYQGFINLRDLKNNLEALASATRDFSLEMTVQATSQKWRNALVAQATSFETIYTTMLQEQRTVLSEHEQQLVNDSLAAITRLITEYKTNFRECLRQRPTYNSGTGIVTAPFRK